MTLKTKLSIASGLLFYPSFFFIAHHFGFVEAMAIFLMIVGVVLQSDASKL